MSHKWITGDMTVAEVLERVPSAIDVFQKHGINPVTYCGPTIRILRLEETSAHCKLHDVEALVADLNAAVAAEQVFRRYHSDK